MSGLSSDPTGSARAPMQDALALLRSDHKRIDRVLSDCAHLADSESTSAADRSALVARLGALLQAHAQIEQELFYPALAVGEAQIEEARREHAAIATQLGELVEGELDHAAFGEHVTALAVQVRAHVADEEAHLFPGAAALDLEALGTRMAVRRSELLGDQGVD